MKRLKTTICIVLCILTAALFGCSETEIPVMDDYRSFLENYEKYDRSDKADDSGIGNDEKDDSDSGKDFGFDVNGFVPIIKSGYDDIDLFAGGIAIAQRNGHSYIIKNGIENPADFIADENFGEIISFSGKYIIVEKEGKKSIVDFSGTAISDSYDEIEAIGNTAFLRNETTFVIMINGKIVKRGVTGNYVLSSENFCKNYDVADTVYVVPDLAPVYYKEFKVIDEPHDGIVPIKSGDKIGYADIVADEILIEPRYMYASQFSEGYAIVRPNSFTDYPQIIDLNGNVKFDFGSDVDFTGKYSARDVIVYPCHDECAIFSVMRNSVTVYGYVDMTLEKPKVKFISGVPYENRAFGRYVLLTDYQKPFDLSKGCVVDDFKADSIVPTSDGFVVKRNDKYSFYDFLLNEIAYDLIEITYREGIYVINDNGVFYICTYNDKILQ